jgi:protein-L-isoaspartate O-methyltransferase
MRNLPLLFLLTALALAGQPAPGSLAPYLPTPDSVVDRMLQAGKLQPGETMFDLGSGDGRIVIAAAKKYKANAIGVELDDALAAKSTQKIFELGLNKTARIIHGNLLAQDYSSADLVTVYLWPQANQKVARLLEQQLKKGARVVAHDFPLGKWKPAATITIPDDGTGRSHMLFVYIR